MNQTPKEIYDEYKGLQQELGQLEDSIPVEARVSDVQHAFLMANLKLDALIDLYGSLLTRQGNA